MPKPFALGRTIGGFFRTAGRGAFLACAAAVAVLAFLGVELAVSVVGGRLGPPVPPECSAATAAIVVAFLLGLLTSRPAVERIRRAIDRLRLRFLRAEEVEVHCSIMRVREDRYRLAGSLEALPFGIVVQALHASWQTGVLLADFDGRVGKVYFEKGKVTEIRYGPYRGPGAFSLMAHDAGGAFLFQPGKRPPRKAAEQDVMRLLTVAARHHEGAEASVHRCVRPMAAAARTPQTAPSSL